MFGYRLITRALHDAMLMRLTFLEDERLRLVQRIERMEREAAVAAERAARRRRVPRVQASPVPAAPAPAPAPAPPVVPPPPAPALPDELMAACERYAYGSREELATNYARAAALHAAGKTPREIVAVIRQGADVDALFVG